jgi:hypothetical protein
MASDIICEMRDMTYNFKYQTKAIDLWQLSMYGIYGSILGVCNIIFTVAMILMTFKFWTGSNMTVKTLLILAICIFTIIQPLVIFLRAKKQAEKVAEHVEIGFDDKGVHVKIKNKTSDLKWNSIKGITKKPSLLVVLSTSKHGFVLTNKVLGKQKEDFYNYVMSKIAL